MHTTTSCHLDEDILLDLHAGTLDGAQGSQILSHLQSCKGCLSLSKQIEVALRGLGRTPFPRIAGLEYRVEKLLVHATPLAISGRSGLSIKLQTAARPGMLLSLWEEAVHPLNTLLGVSHTMLGNLWRDSETTFLVQGIGVIETYRALNAAPLEYSRCEMMAGKNDGKTVKSLYFNKFEGSITPGLLKRFCRYIEKPVVVRDEAIQFHSPMVAQLVARFKDGLGAIEGLVSSPSNAIHAEAGGRLESFERMFGGLQFSDLGEQEQEMELRDLVPNGVN